MESTPFVCVVDDQADYRFIVQQLFNQYLPTYPVRFFANGQTLLDQLPRMSPKPSLILLDQHMPGLNGHQTLLRLKEHPGHKRIPVVIMSGEASAREINECYQAGANSFLLKTIDFSSLKETMQTVCHYWLETNQHPSAI